MARLEMPISKWWLQAAILTYVVGFCILGVLAYLTYSQQPPIPAQVVDPAGQTVFTRDDVMAGMNVFQRYGVMQYGTVYGHGAYLGPDFTAEYLHKSAESLLRAARARPQGAVGAREFVAAVLHQNTYDPATDRLVWSTERVAAHNELVAYYQGVFRGRVSEGGRQSHWISDPKTYANSLPFLRGLHGPARPTVQAPLIPTRTTGRPSRSPVITSPLSP